MMLHHNPKTKQLLKSSRFKYNKKIYKFKVKQSKFKL